MLEEIIELMWALKSKKIKCLIMRVFKISLSEPLFFLYDLNVYAVMIIDNQNSAVM